MALKICFVNTLDIIGGAERCSFDLMQGLRAYGHQNSLVVGRKLSNDPDVHACTYPAWDWKPRALLHSMVGLTDTTLVTPFQMIFHHPAFRTADVVNVHNMHGCYWNFWTLPVLSRQVPVVLTLHDEWFLTGDCVYTYDCERWKHSCGKCPQMSWPMRPDLGGRDQTRLNLFLKRTAAALSQPERIVIVTPSDWLRERVGMAPHLRRFRALTIPNGIDTDVFYPHEKREARARFGLPQDKFCFLFFAANLHDPRKGVRLLEQTLAKFGLPENSVLFLVGNSADQIVSKLPGLPVYTANYISDRAAVAQCLSAADFLLLFSSADNLPYSAIEAGSCGCPVLARGVGGIPEIVTDGVNGFLLKGNPEEPEIAAKMQAITELSGCDLARMGAEARARVERLFSMEKFLKAYESLLYEVTCHSPSRRRGNSAEQA